MLRNTQIPQYVVLSSAVIRCGRAHRPLAIFKDVVREVHDGSS